MNIVKYFTNCIAVFQGGGCKAIAYIGAYEKAYEEGMFFSELAGTSAGAVIAALIAAGGSPKDLRKVVNDVNFSQFKKPCGKSCWPVRLAEAALAWNEKRKHQHPQKDNFWQTIKECKPYSWKALNKNLGFFDSEVIEVKMREWLKELTGKDNVTFADLAPNLHIVATDVVNKSVMEWNKNDTPDMPVAKAVRASCSIPVYFTPTERIWEVMMTDGTTRHIPMIDFHIPSSSSNLHVVEDVCDALGMKQGYIVDSGASFHFIGDRLLTQEELMRLLIDALLFCPIVDGVWISHQLRERSCSLRIDRKNGVETHVAKRLGR